MTKVLQRDPGWLAAPAPAASLFKPDSEGKPQIAHDAGYDAPPRKIAHRGTEIFVVAGSELRWSDLVALKDLGEDINRRNGGRSEQDDGHRAYRVLKTPVARPITQLSISPSGDYMAILTSHTCHVCILPSSSHLHSQDTSPLRLKTFQLGPTAHVLEQAPLVSAIWHPLSPAGDCLVTITHDACVRLWEVDAENRSSFNEPALAVDLKKLANATSTQTDFSTSKYGTNKGFSPDDVEMQVAAACFGGQGSEDEHGWASMTLWVAMTEGDVYALCPFLPSRWRASATLLPSLSTSVMEKSRATSKDADVSESEKRTTDQQCKWLAEVDAQDPILYPGSSEFDTVETYGRPTSLSAVPKLQGPFQLAPEPDFGEITDIHVIAPKIDDDALYDEVNENEQSEDGLSVGIVCLATSTNEVHICLDVDGVEAEWLPSKRSRAYTFDNVDDLKELVLFETIDLAESDADDDGWPTVTASPLDRYEFFATHPTGVCSLSLRPWINVLEDELSAPSASGAAFRIDIVLNTAHTSIAQVVDLPANDSANTAVAIYGPSLGNIVISTANNIPYASLLSAPSTSHPFAPDDAPSASLALPAPEPRTPYRPAPEFDQPSALPQLLKTASDRNLLGSDTRSQVRFSPATLQLLTEAHRIMSSETHRIGMAAAELFRRCERMRAELHEQLRKVSEVAERVDYVTGNEDGEDLADEDDDEANLVGRERIEHRIELVHEKSSELNARYEQLRRKMGRLGGKELSAREKAFQTEVGRLERSVLPQPSGDDGAGADGSPGQSSTLASRLEAVQALQEDLVKRIDEAAERVKGERTDAKERPQSRASGGVGVGSQYRKQKLGQVMQMLERETVLVEAVMEKLARLQRS